MGSFSLRGRFAGLPEPIDISGKQARIRPIITRETIRDPLPPVQTGLGFSFLGAAALLAAKVAARPIAAVVTKVPFLRKFTLKRSIRDLERDLGIHAPAVTAVTTTVVKPAAQVIPKAVPTIPKGLVTLGTGSIAAGVGWEIGTSLIADQMNPLITTAAKFVQKSARYVYEAPIGIKTPPHWREGGDKMGNGAGKPHTATRNGFTSIEEMHGVAYQWDTAPGSGVTGGGRYPVFSRLADGHIAVKRLNGTIKHYRPYKPFVIGKRPSIQKLARAERLINRFAKSFKKHLRKHS